MPSSGVAWGIDIGAAAIKAVKLIKSPEGPKAVDFVIVPHKRVLSTPDVDPDEVMRLSLGALMSQFGDELRGSTTVVSVPGHTAFARFAKLPPVDPKGVANLVKFEAVQQIPFPIEEVEWDYQLFRSEDSPEIEVGIFAMTRERIAERLALWGGAGLTPDAITISPVAAYNAVAYDFAFTERTPGTIVLDIGTTATDLIIGERGRVWIRTFPVGGHAFTEAIAETFKLTYTKAEKLKAEAETSKYKKHVFQALKPVFVDFVDEVKRSINYYRDTHPDAQIERLIGVGSTFKLFGLRKLLAQQLGIDVARLDRFRQASLEGAAGTDFEAASVNLVTAYGLALQGLGYSPIAANLMPTSVIRQAMWKRKTPWFVTAAAIGLAAGGVSFLRPFLDNANASQVDNLPQVRQVKSKGADAKRKWDEAAKAHTIAFAPANIAHLTAGRDLYPDLLNEVNAMLGSAAASVRDAGGPDGDAFAFRGLSMQFTGAGEKVPAAALPKESQDRRTPPPPPPGDAGWGGGRDERPSAPPARNTRGSSGGNDAAPGEITAGQFGAVRVTLSVDTQNDGGLPFVDETLLTWLRDQAAQEGGPFNYEAPPKADDVQREVVRGPIANAEPAAPDPGGAGGGRDERRRDAADPFGGGRRAAPRGAAPAAGGTGVDGLAPLPGSAPELDPAREVIRYTLSWVVQLKDPSAPPEVRAEAATAEDVS
ncbi:MAG: type IV pilus assembly protein PilM [Phycisphaerales bacterium]|nr:type IV pilus assembly protein PilM [Phycisphaerales bacterium]